jgi:hypothetical protein
MFDLNKDQFKIKLDDLFKYFQNHLRIAIEIILLIAFTLVVYICLLYCAKYLWVIFTATQVGQTYAKLYEESYRITNDILSRNFISLAINITLTSFVICLIVSAVLKFLHINRFFYSNRSLFIRIIFAGLPLTCIVAVYMYYRGDISHMDTAFTVVLVPTLCVFTGSFRFSEEFVPELIDIISIFSKQEKGIKHGRKEEEVRCQAYELINKKESKKRDVDRQIKLQDIWDSNAKYIIFILVTIIVAGILNIISQTPKVSKRTEPASASVAAAIVTATKQEPAPLKTEVITNERFIARADKIVLDTKTNLMWAAEESETLNWYEAKKYCKKFHGGGYSNWRMPTLKELEGLYDPNKQPDCGCVTNLIEMYNGPNCWEWSSETKDPDAALFAFNLNGVQWLPKSNNSSVHIRPVRSNK